MKNICRVFVFLLFMSIVTKADIVVPPIVVIQFNHNNSHSKYYNRSLPESILSAESSFSSILSTVDSPSEDYRIYGSVYTNCVPSECSTIGGIYLELSKSLMILENDRGKTMKVDLRGTIEGENIKVGSNLVSFIQTNDVQELPWKANLSIIGDVRESTVTPAHDAGIYFGVLTVKVTMF